MAFFRSLAAAALLVAAPVLAQQQLSIATGGTGGVYYPMGGGLAEVVNSHVDGYSATAEVTGASVENMGLVARGDADLALADTVVQSHSGTGRFDGQPLPMIRGVATLYANMIQIVTLADSGITYDDIDEQQLNFNETADALANGDVEAGFRSVGAPTSSILNLSTTQAIHIIALTDDQIAAAREANPLFTRATLPGGLYESAPDSSTGSGRCVDAHAGQRTIHRHGSHA